MDEALCRALRPSSAGGAGIIEDVFLGVNTSQGFGDVSNVSTTPNSAQTPVTYQDGITTAADVSFAVNFTDGSQSVILDEVKHYLVAVVNPVLCVLGIIGNVLNILVLTRRRVKAALDCSMERSAHLGLITLALSDMLYCTSSLPDAFLSRQQTVFSSKGFWLYVQVYGPSFQNIFMNTSTWLTVIMAAGRYVAICRPLHARYLVGVKITRIAVTATFVTCSLLHLPSFWTYEVVELHCVDTSLYILDHGFFVMEKKMKIAFSYVWSTLGYLIPVVILTYCNFHLILALRASYKMRKLYRVNSKHNTNAGSQITPTLVAIVCMFIVLVSPSEILHFWFYSADEQQAETLTAAIVITNVLHTMNFAFNFVLYCIVNANFRKTWKSFFCCMRKKRYSPVRRFVATTQTNLSTRSCPIAEV